MPKEVPPTVDLPKPTKVLSAEEALVTIPDEGLAEPSDLGFDGEDWDEEKDGPLPDYPAWRIAAELEQAVTDYKEVSD